MHRLDASSRLAVLGAALALAISLLGTPGAFAADPATPHSLQLDPGATHLGFDLGATGHDVHGILHLDHGSVAFDPASGRAWGEIDIDARLSETGNKKRDKTMHNKVLESESHPFIRFKPERVEGKIALEGASDFVLVGTVELLGVAHPMSLPTHAEIHDGHVAAQSTFDVPYIDWGLHNPSMLVLRVAKIVQVTVDLEGDLSEGDATTRGQ